MKTSRYFERTLFYDRSPTADEYYARSAESIFETDPRRSKIEVRIQSSINATYYERKQENGPSSGLEKDEQKKVNGSAIKSDSSADLRSGAQKFPEDHPSKVDHIENVDADQYYDPESESNDAWSLSSKASSTALLTALDQHRGSSPPTYPGPPKLTVVDLDTGSVQNFVKRTRNDFRVFYLRQRHSNSRLRITKELFEQLLRCCHVFPRFNEYLIGFGVKGGATEVGPPPLKFRPLCESHNNNYHGFGASGKVPTSLAYVHLLNLSRMLVHPTLCRIYQSCER
jgi:hypothetical protein